MPNVVDKFGNTYDLSQIRFLLDEDVLSESVGVLDGYDEKDRAQVLFREYLKRHHIKHGVHYSPRHYSSGGRLKEQFIALYRNGDARRMVITFEITDPSMVTEYAGLPTEALLSAVRKNPAKFVAAASNLIADVKP